MAEPLRKIPTHEQFNAQYNRRGLQPSVGGVSPSRNVRVEKRYDPSRRRKKADRSIRVNTNPVVPPKKVNQEKMRVTQKPEPVAAQPAFTTRSSIPPKTAEPSQRKWKGKKVVSKADRAKGLFWKGLTLSWTGFIWGMIGSFFGLLSVFFFAVTGVIGFAEEFGENNEAVGFLFFVGEMIFETVSEAVRFATGDRVNLSATLEAVMPVNIWGLMHLILMITLWFIYASIYFGATLMDLRPLSGVAESTKHGFLMLSFVMSFIPLLNLFPWFIGWIFVIAKYPK